ncbi:transcription factor EC-like [Oppia nitens]|uniref:transcription factor EC-like n=1 Tax=Oppia nitens TaxID=1686743 RepID=UPI0023DA2557|nr:transcription factor EC-like [Oppia nitens]XP_054155477.1 transcription factor EC-like [Oppia nitens]
MSRTNLKQQLMKQQLIQEELRQKQPPVSLPRMSQSLVTNTTNPGALQPQHTTSVPLSLQQQFPHVMTSHHFLQQKVQQSQQLVRQTLENPTNYHVLQTQQKQHNSPLHPHPIHSHSVPNVPSQLSPNCLQPQDHTHTHQNTGHSLSSSALGLNGPQSPFPLSPDSPLSAPPSSACSTSELDDVFDVLGGFDSRDVSAQMDDQLVGAIAATLPADMNYFLEQEPTTPTHDISSSSCPQLNDQELKAWQKDRQKKDNHNQIERRRRYNINDRIKELGTLLPRSEDTKHFDLVKDMKQNKGTILKASVDYVRLLKRENNRLNEQDKKYREMESNYRLLQMQFQDLQLQMRQQNSQTQHQPNSTSNWPQMVNTCHNTTNNNCDNTNNMSTGGGGDPFRTAPNSLPLNEIDKFAATQSLHRIIKQEYTAPTSPLSPSQASSGLGSSLPSASPAQQYFHFNELTHDPILSAASLSIKNEAYSPQSMDICN